MSNASKTPAANVEATVDPGVVTVKDAQPAPSPARADKPLASIFIVMTDAYEGQEDEFNDWYTNIHCHDTMRFKGSVAVQRWKLSRHQLRYNAAYFGPWQPWLCIYEVGDTQENIDVHIADTFTDRLPITSAQRCEAAEDFYYVPSRPGKDAIEAFASQDGDLITIRMNAKPGKEAEFIKWYTEDYLPRTLKLIGFKAGDLYRLAAIQLIDGKAPFDFTAVYHVADPMVAIESLDSHLANANTVLDCPLVDTQSVRVACYSPITSRFTSEQARNLPRVQRQLEDEFREATKDRVHRQAAEGGFRIKGT